jgi:purine nucleosidase
MTSQKPKRIIIDCDTGVDDAMAIIFALKSDSLIVDSITTVNGNVPVEQATLNTLKILEFIGRQDVPVAIGAPKPWVVEPVHSKHVFGEDGLGNMSSKLPNSKTAIAKDAVTHILDTVADGNIDAIVAIGPLTNIANAYKQNKELMNSVKELIVMGGAINEKGNITEFAEFNFYCDPHAADYVLANATNLTLIPLDVTNQAQLFENELELIIEGRIRELLSNILKPWFKFSFKVSQDYVALHDPLVLAYALNNSYFQRKRIKLEVCVDFNKRGQSVILPEAEKGIFNDTNYCSNFSQQLFKEILFKALNSVDSTS